MSDAGELQHVLACLFLQPDLQAKTPGDIRE